MDLLGKQIGQNCPPLIVAEISCNHESIINQGELLVSMAKGAGADAVKIQLYNADEMTLDHSGDDFIVKAGPWKGQNLHALYSKTGTSRNMAIKLFEYGKTIGIPVFASVFSEAGVEFLESLSCPAYKIASFENTHVNLIRRVAKTRKPVLISTGMASYSEVSEAYEVSSPGNVVLMHCVSSYPTGFNEANLGHIHNLANIFHCPIGFSDHTINIVIGQFATVAGARVLEKHIMLEGTVTEDSAFSLTPFGFKEYAKLARLAAHCAYVNKVEGEESSKQFRRSLYAVKDIKAGEVFSPNSIRAIRPGYGLPCRDYGRLLYKRASVDIKAGTALKKEYIG